MKYQDLLDLGLDEKESLIYLSMLEIGPSGISAIARHSKQNRVTTYEVIDRLIEKRLAFQSIEGSRKTYTAESPERLKSLMEEKVKKLNSLLPELFALEGKENLKPKIKYYEGISGIKQAYMNSVYSKENIIMGFVGADQLNLRNELIKDFWENEYIPARREHEKFGNIVVPDTGLGKEMKKRNEEGYREVRLVPHNQYNFESEIHFVDDIVTFISFSETESFAMTVQSKAIVNTLKMVFKIVWNQAY